MIFESKLGSKHVLAYIFQLKPCNVQANTVVSLILKFVKNQLIYSYLPKLENVFFRYRYQISPQNNLFFRCFWPKYWNFPLSGNSGWHGFLRQRVVQSEERKNRNLEYLWLIPINTRSKGGWGRGGGGAGEVGRITKGIEREKWSITSHLSVHQYFIFIFSLCPSTWYSNPPNYCLFMSLQLHTVDELTL